MESLICDMLEWLEAEPRSYDEVMSAWRTSCPRLTVWEDAWDQGLVSRHRLESGDVAVRVTGRGRDYLYRKIRPKDDRPVVTAAHAIT
ncbi:MAG: hypothetical protein RIC36_03545 [Rhodospirillales bacterium]